VFLTGILRTKNECLRRHALEKNMGTLRPASGTLEIPQDRQAAYLSWQFGQSGGLALDLHQMLRA